MTLRKKVASAFSFRHLTGLSKAAETDDEDRREDADDESPDKKDDDDTGPGNGKKGKKAVDKKDDESAESDDPDDKDDDGESKDKAKSKASDDDDAEDDDDEEEMRGNSAAAKARRRERARCASIFASKAAGKNPVLAANLAFSTAMPRKEALAVLESTPSASSSGADRSARNPGIGSGGALSGNSKQATASRWDAAFAKAVPNRR